MQDIDRLRVDGVVASGRDGNIGGMSLTYPAHVCGCVWVWVGEGDN